MSRRTPPLRLALSLLAALVVSPGACQPPGPRVPENSEPPVVLAAADESDDAIRRILVVRQRELYSVLLSEKREGLAAFFDPATISVPRTGVVVARWTGERRMIVDSSAGYFQLLAGRPEITPDRMPDEFEVRVLSPAAAFVVTRGGSPGSRIVTSWALGLAGWRVTRMVELSAEAAANALRVQWGPRHR